MKEQIEKMYIQALIDDLPPNVFADQVLRLFNVGGAKRKLVCPHCKSGEENFTRNGHHIWCRKCDYEFNVG